jgi:hypothetical protein
MRAATKARMMTERMISIMARGCAIMVLVVTATSFGMDMRTAVPGA